MYSDIECEYLTLKLKTSFSISDYYGFNKRQTNGRYLSECLAISSESITGQ